MTAPLMRQPAAVASIPSGAGLQPEPMGGTGAPRMNPLARILAALKRYKWIILVTTMVGTGLGVVASRLLKPKYEVRATLFFEALDEAAGPVQAAGLLTSGQWLELLTTFSILDPVVRGRRLFLEPRHPEDDRLFEGFGLADRFTPGMYTITFSKDGKTYDLTQRSGRYREAGAVGDSVGRRLGFRWVPQIGRAYRGVEVAFELVTPREASVKLKDDLQTRMNAQKGRFLSLQLTGEDAEKTAGTLNLLIHQFVTEAARLKRSKLTELVATLDTQVTAGQIRLRNAERELEGYKVRTVTLPREDVPVSPGLQMTEPTVYANYFSQRQALDAIHRDRTAVEDVLRRTRNGELAVDAFTTITAVRQAPDFGKVLSELSQAEAELRGFRAKFTDDYKPIQYLKERIDTIRKQTIPAYAAALIDQLTREEKDLASRIRVAGLELQEVPARSINEARLRREVASAEGIYNNLVGRFESARLSEVSAIPDVRIQDEAVAPTKPTKNRAWVIIAMGIMGGLGLGLGLAVLLDLIDRRFRYPDQVTHDLGLPILGAVPEIKQAARGATMTSEEAAQVIESFRSIRLSLSHCYNPGDPVIFTVSSPSPGDGKSLVASNLALSFAEAGYRTLLIDGDTRRGELHRTFAAERRPGLLDHLAGQATIEQVLRTTSHGGLSLLTSGSRLHQGPELLGSARMAELMTQVRQRFNVIIIDSPPLGAGIDPFVLGSMTGHMLLVLRAGETDRQLAEAKLRIMDRLPIRLLGAVLNDIHSGTVGYKYYAYSYGYAAEDEEPSEQLPASVNAREG